MNQIYSKALDLIILRIIQCGKAQQASLDAYSLNYWQLQLNKANKSKAYILKRANINQKVLYVDFNLKKRVA